MRNVLTRLLIARHNSISELKAKVFHIEAILGMLSAPGR
jgi:hypothetical protein